MSKAYLFLLFACVFPVISFAQSTDLDKRDPDRHDMEALRRWLQDKRLVTMREIGGDLSLSGEVRTEFQTISEEKKGKQQRGKDGETTKPMYAWDVEVNIMLDYRTDRSWAAIKLEYDNDMGQKSGTVNKIRLEKAYLGGRIIPGDTFIMDMEIGRRYLSNVYSSKIQFASIYDGILFRFSKAFIGIGDYFANLGSFIIDDKSNHYGFIAEFGALRIANIGLNLTYSLIDWYKPGSESQKGNTNEENKLADLRYRFLVSQLLMSYQFYPEWNGKKLVRLYAAVATNHLALRDPLKKAKIEGQAFGRQNWAWYTGVSMGLVKKKYDWAIDANFQWLQAQSIPSYDVAGIGRGNAANSGLYTVNVNGTGGASTKATAVGNANYYGFQTEGLYAFTDNITIQQNLMMSWTLNKSIGPNLIFKQYEMEFIYAF